MIYYLSVIFLRVEVKFIVYKFLASFLFFFKELILFAFLLFSWIFIWHLPLSTPAKLATLIKVCSDHFFSYFRKRSYPLVVGFALLAPWLPFTFFTENWGKKKPLNFYMIHLFHSTGKSRNNHLLISAYPLHPLIHILISLSIFPNSWLLFWLIFFCPKYFPDCFWKTLPWVCKNMVTW